MKKSVFKNAIFKFLLNIFNLVVPIIVGPYVLRKLGPDLMGVINYSQAIFAYFFIFASFGVYQYGLREISKARNDKNKLKSVFTSLFFITVISNIVITLIYYIYIRITVTTTSMYIVSIILTFNFISNIFYTEWVNEALESYDFITIKTIIIRIIYVVVLLLIVKSSKDYGIYVLLTVLSTFFNNIVSYFYVKRYIKFDFKNIEIKRHIKPMLLVVILSNANVLYTQLDKVMLGEYVSKSSVAFYTMAQNISYMINAVLLSLIHVSIPRLSHYIGNGQKNKYISLLNKISRMYLFLLFPASIGMIILSKEIVLIYGGEQYASAYQLLMLFSVYIITIAYDTIFSNQIMYVNGFEKEQVRIVFFGGFINLILNILILNLGIFNENYSVITTIFANIICVISQYIFIKKRIKLDYNIFSFDKSKYLILSLIFIPVTLLIKMLNYNMFIYIILVIVVNATIYFSILYFTKDDIFLEGLNKLLKKKFK
ncbi:oligosaccharide flippase family protein [Clostridium perfringens]|uniref:oligosaccharide flippase family protein n=1 Tax=Clostridium perfringens TaxID=1502 RepID=UPI001C8840B0|nr:oligosaccharide flippase family protein [Clostridium perfringens]MDK0552946.1 oligosaccharide flippase family protein [Clostridium perfringens]MDK0834144.1 oligosaccharide flippase family protein [Clostridium perfringens]MDK0878298.1 oligosaccharide flippase family protein [Clostridium perfringens]